jgi:hypothetical protein
MRYIFTIIAVDQVHYTPELLIEQSGTQSGRGAEKVAPTITSDRAEALAEWLKSKAPPCFSPDVEATKKMVDDCLLAAFKSLKGVVVTDLYKVNARRCPPKSLIQLKRSGYILWLSLETT